MSNVGAPIALARAGRPRWAGPGRRLASVAFALLLSSGGARGQGGGLLFPSPLPPPKAPVVWDPSLPQGAVIGSDPPRPSPGTEPPACSARHPVCVYRTPRVPAALALRALETLEWAYRRLVSVLGLPRPLPSATVDLYLSPEGRPELVTGADQSEPGSWDRSRTYCLLGQPERADLRRVATQCLGEAIAHRLDAAETPDLARAYATELWWIIGDLDGLDLERIMDAQAHPGRALISREPRPESENGALLLDFLEAELGQTGPGDFVTLLFALSASETPPDARRWHNEPDAFDVLRHTLDDKPSRMADLLGRFAVARALGAPGPALASAGPLGRLRNDWNIKWSSLPRRLAPMRPLEPLGLMSVRVELDDLPLNATLGFQAEWEMPAAMQWMLVRLDRDGRELSRLRVPFQERGFSVEQRLVDLAEAAAVLIVGINLGGTDLAHPFDPDIAPFEPHGCTVFLAPL
jgi:hypothetical protein